jgi:uncharacterized protein
MSNTSFSRCDERAPTFVDASAQPVAARMPPSLALIHGEITHRRRRPAENAFTYSAFCLRLPLSQLASLPSLGISHNAKGLISFHDRDHGACDSSDLASWIRSLLAAERIECGGEIVLYAFPRMLGYAFNPVSFWVCHDEAGAVRAVLCEVRNTFGERHSYLLASPDGRPLISGEALTTRKVFHVSPFCEVNGEYRFRFHFGRDRWLARIDYFDGEAGADAPGDPLLETWISGVPAPIDKAAIRGLWWRYRFFTAGVIARIHWQALKLAVKRVPFFARPAPPRAATTR